MQNRVHSLFRGGADTSFVTTLRANPKKTLVVTLVLLLLAAVETAGYFRDVERPATVHWLFKPRSK